MRVTFRSLETWPYPPTDRRRGPGTFSAGWQSTLNLLAREVALLGGGDVTLAAGFREADLRLDGMPRAGAREPSHPGVILAFTAADLDGRPRLEYGTDVCEREITSGGDEYPSIERGRRLIREAGGERAALRATHPDAGGARLDFESVRMAQRAIADVGA
jgi:hypothetical protein